MKNPRDPRHLVRIQVVKSLFQWAFNPKSKIGVQLANQVIAKVKKLDKVISQSAPEWPIKQINHIDLAILRLAVYELLITKTDPPKVIIDEAIEIAKYFGSENSAKFINGVLGSVLNEYRSS